jgi:hypothetical protein
MAVRGTASRTCNSGQFMIAGSGAVGESRAASFDTAILLLNSFPTLALYLAIDQIGMSMHRIIRISTFRVLLRPTLEMNRLQLNVPDLEVHRHGCVVSHLSSKAVCHSLQFLAYIRAACIPMSIVRSFDSRPRMGRGCLRCWLNDDI